MVWQCGLRADQLESTMSSVCDWLKNLELTFETKATVVKP